MKSLKVLAAVTLSVVFAYQNQEDQHGTREQTSNWPNASEPLQRRDATWNQNNLDPL